MATSAAIEFAFLHLHVCVCVCVLTDLLVEGEEEESDVCHELLSQSQILCDYHLWRVKYLSHTVLHKAHTQSSSEVHVRTCTCIYIVHVHVHIT